MDDACEVGQLLCICILFLYFVFILYSICSNCGVRFVLEKKGYNYEYKKDGFIWIAIEGIASLPKPSGVQRKLKKQREELEDLRYALTIYSGRLCSYL